MTSQSATHSDDDYFERVVIEYCNGDCSDDDSAGDSFKEIEAEYEDTYTYYDILNRVQDALAGMDKGKLMEKYEGGYIFSNGRSVDIKYMDKGQSYVVSDLFRSRKEHITYEIIELKYGSFDNTKYESKEFDPPVVIVFSNDVPCLKKFPTYRWCVWNIIDNRLKSYDQEMCQCKCCRNSSTSTPKKEKIKH